MRRPPVPTARPCLHARAPRPVLLWRRDAVTFLCISGAILNALLSKLLKQLINQARPEGARLADPGMPSSHAQSLGYFATYLSLVAIRATWHTQLLPARVPAGLAKAAAVCALLGVGGGAAAHRVRTGLHTWPQIAVGWIVGATSATLWLLYAQPLLLRRSAGFGAGAVAALFVVGALTVGSVERYVGAKLKGR